MAKDKHHGMALPGYTHRDRYGCVKIVAEGRIGLQRDCVAGAGLGILSTKSGFTLV